jgi:hypothetical protein
VRLGVAPREATTTARIRATRRMAEAMRLRNKPALAATSDDANVA